MTKIYAILYNSYEYDDLNQGELTPRFLSLDKEDAYSQFKQWVDEEKECFNEYCDKYYKDEISKRPEDFQILSDTDDHFECFINTWTYEYKLVEYETERDLKY